MSPRALLARSTRVDSFDRASETSIGARHDVIVYRGRRIRRGCAMYRALEREADRAFAIARAHDTAYARGVVAVRAETLGHTFQIVGGAQ